MSDTADRALVEQAKHYDVFSDDKAHMIHLLSAALARRIAEGEWRPIATVPRNVPVLVWTRLGVDTACYADAPGCGPAHGTTHWKPLPSPPGAALVAEEPPR